MKKKQLQWAINPVTGQMMVREVEPKKRGRMKLVLNKDGLEMRLPRERELDEKYFDKGCERFAKECKGEIKLKDGSIVKQASLFDL